MEGLLTEEVLAIVMTALLVVAGISMVIITVIIVRIVEEDIKNERNDKKNHK